MQKNNQKRFFNIGVNYKKADAYTRGKFSLCKDSQVALLNLAKERGFKGVFVLSTCNRTEISGFSERPCQLIELLCEFSEGSIEEFTRISNIYCDFDAVNHLFRIGTGLESQILGDYEIVGQLKQSYKLAKKYKTSDAYTERLINSILQASKKVKNQTKISSGTTSVSYAAVQYIIKNLPDYNAKNVLVFGLGKMGKHTCKNLSEYTSIKSVCLINRTEEKALAFAKESKNIRSSKIENLKEEINKTDILIVSTGADYHTVTKDLIAKDKKLLILDLSMPENVDSRIRELKNITLVNVDELSKVTDETLALRQKEIPFAESIIETHKKEFKEWLNHRRFTPTIAAVKQSLESIKNDEINFHKKRFENFDENQAEILTSRIIQKITTQFVKHLKEDETSVSQSLQVIEKVFQQ